MLNQNSSKILYYSLIIYISRNYQINSLMPIANPLIPDSIPTPNSNSLLTSINTSSNVSISHGTLLCLCNLSSINLLISHPPLSRCSPIIYPSLITPNVITNSNSHSIMMYPISYYSTSH